MAGLENLTKMLGASGADDVSGGDSSPLSSKDPSDDVDSEDSGAEVFNSAAQEAFHAIKEGDSQAFTEALKTAITGMM